MTIDESWDQMSGQPENSAARKWLRNSAAGAWFAGFHSNSRRLAVTVRVVAAGLLLFGVPTILSAQSVIITEYDTPTSLGKPYSYPQGITRGPDGAMWFIEWDANKIGRITVAGAITEFSIPTSGSSPYGIVTGPDGALWFTESLGNKIGRITTAGVISEYPLPTSSSQPNGSIPLGITVGPDGALWFTEGWGCGKVGRITTAGVISEYLSTSCSSPSRISTGPDGALWFTATGEIGRITTSGVASYYLTPKDTELTGITAGPDGALWFTEYEGNKIGRITTAGVITEFPVPTPNSFPEDIAIGPDGALWFTESGAEANRIGRITAAGLISEYQLTSPNGPDSIAMGQDGSLWFTESAASKVGRAMVVPPSTGNATVATSPPGLPVTIDGITYTGSISFNWAVGESHSVSVASPLYGGYGTRYVYSSWSDGGTESHSITVSSSPAAFTITAMFVVQYRLITSVSPPTSGSISVKPMSLDGFYTSGTPVQFTATAISGFQFSNWSSDLSGTANPQSLMMGGPHSVQANFVGSSQSISFSTYPTTSPLSDPFDIAAGPDGALWFTELRANRIGRITTAGMSTEYTVPSANTTSNITTGGDGALWFTESAGNKIGRISTAGVITEYPIPTSGSFPYGIATGPDDALWFTEVNANKIGRITTAGAVTEYLIPTSGSAPYGIATGPDAALWFIEQTGNRIGRITTAGAITEYSVPTSNSSPVRITVGPDGALWFTEIAANRIGRITTAGVTSEYPIATTGTYPFGITTGPDGALWFTEVQNNNTPNASPSMIGRITTTGAITEYTIDGSPNSIITGPDGALWFTEGLDSIRRAVLPTGTPCTYSLPETAESFSSAGGTGTAAVRAAAGGPGGCPWMATSGVPWVTITSGSNGAGNGAVGYTVGTNPSNVSRSGTLTIAGHTYTVGQAGSTSTLSCTASIPSVPQVAVEGRTELLGDMLLSCTGLSGTTKADIMLTLNTNVTNALVNGATDAVMTLNGVASSQGGVVAGANSLVWPGVSLVPAENGTMSVRISKVRADATLLLTQRIVANPGNPQPTAITGQVNFSAAVPVPVIGGPQIMANAVQTLVFTESPASPLTGGAQTYLAMVFQEAEAISFTAGATRLHLSLRNVPETVQVYAPIYPMEGAARAQLYSTDVNGEGGSPLAGGLVAGGLYQTLTANAGTVTATWVVLAADPSVNEDYTFPLLLLNAAPNDLNAMQVSASLAPVSAVSTPSANAPVPRYRDFSATTSLTNLRISNLVQTTGSASGALVFSPQAVLSTRVASDVIGSKVNFTYQVVNDTTDAAQTASNVVIGGRVSPGLLVTGCQASGGANCTVSGNSEADVTYASLGPGQSATLTVTAQVDPSFTGAVLQSLASAVSDQVNLDLLASTSSSSFIAGNLGGGGANLAQGQPASQSSTLPGSPPASVAVDGNTDGSFGDGSVTATNLDNNPWWQVDLGSSASINSINIWNRTDCCGSRLNDYWVFVSNAPFAATDAPGMLAGKVAFSSHQTTAPNPSVSIPVNAQGRYVRVQLTGPGYLSLAEVQVFGGSSGGGGGGNLTIGVSHAGSFLQGQSPASYILLVQNSGSGATTGTVTVTDILPAGLTATAISGPGWTCSLGTVTCSRGDSLAAGSVYPPIALSVSVAPNAASSLTNQASLSNGSATSSASDPTIILPAFSDILPTDSFLPAIDLLRESGITTGCSSSPPMYCSTSNITEAQMAVFIVRSVMGGDNFTYTQTPYFSDVPASYLYFPWIQKMQDLGIAVACGVGQFCPETPVTRGIMSVLIIRARYGVLVPANYPPTPYFTDVPASHPYFPWIQKMKQFGITSGCGSTTFCPDDPVTRGQMAVFIMRGEFNQLLPSGTPIVAWAYPASASAGQAVTVTILGQNTNFATGLTQVSAGTGITVSNIAVANGTTLTAQFVLAPGAPSGPRSITVTTGSEEATLPNGFKVQ